MRARTCLAAGLTLAGVFGLGLAAGLATGPFRLPDWLSSSDQPAADAALPPSPPTRVAIRSLDLRARVHPVGLDADGAIAAPDLGRADEAGWYAQGPAPGQYGAAVIVGHVDDTEGPAVFHHLTRLRPGDRVEVTRRDGRVAVFQVTTIREYDKSTLPAEVYGDFRRPELRLITCGGRWVGDEVGYAANVVVFAVLVDSRDG